MTITTPPTGATYTYEQVLDAGYSCSVGAEATLKSCPAPVANGSPINTSTVGNRGQSFEVTATDNDNQTTSVTNIYTVTAAPTSLTASPQLDLTPPARTVGLDVASATLTSGGTALAGQTITFTDGSLHLCTAVTNSIGNASGSIPPADEVWVDATNVIFVVGAQKLVPTVEAARERIFEYSLKHEDARAYAAYSMNSYVGKNIEIHQEQPGRIHVVVVRQVVGF